MAVTGIRGGGGGPWIADDTWTQVAVGTTAKGGALDVRADYSKRLGSEPTLEAATSTARRMSAGPAPGVLVMPDGNQFALYGAHVTKIENDWGSDAAFENNQDLSKLRLTTAQVSEIVDGATTITDFDRVTPAKFGRPDVMSRRIESGKYETILVDRVELGFGFGSKDEALQAAVRLSAGDNPAVGITAAAGWYHLAPMSSSQVTFSVPPGNTQPFPPRIPHTSEPQPLHLTERFGDTPYDDSKGNARRLIAVVDGALAFGARWHQKPATSMEYILERMTVPPVS